MAKRELTYVQKVERSISTTYRERLWTPFINAIKTYKLIEEGGPHCSLHFWRQGFHAAGETDADAAAS